MHLNQTRREVIRFIVTVLTGVAAIGVVFWCTACLLGLATGSVAVARAAGYLAFFGILLVASSYVRTRTAFLTLMGALAVVAAAKPEWSGPLQIVAHIWMPLVAGTLSNVWRVNGGLAGFTTSFVNLALMALALGPSIPAVSSRAASLTFVGGALLSGWLSGTVGSYMQRTRASQKPPRDPRNGQP